MEPPVEFEDLPVTNPEVSSVMLDLPVAEPKNPVSIPKCEHGVYDPHGTQEHCSVCNPVVVSGMIKKVGQISLIQPESIPNKFQTEIKKALAGC
jgi:hypothetical protein